MEEEVLRLQPHRTGRKTHLHTKHFKQLRREANPGEQSDTPPHRKIWLCLVDIVHHMLRTGEIPQELR